MMLSGTPLPPCGKNEDKVHQTSVDQIKIKNTRNNNTNID